MNDYCYVGDEESVILEARTTSRLTIEFYGVFG